MKIVIIEAPGKVTSLTHTFAKIWPGIRFRVLATSGLMLDLPKENRALGVDPFTLTPTGEVLLPGGQRFLVQFNAAITEAGGVDGVNEVVVLTDPDREGEGIADQVWLFLRQSGLADRATRVYATDMSEAGIRAAVSRTMPHAGMVAARTARRVIDRVVPHFLAMRLQLKRFSGLGRVQLAALSVANKAMAEWRPHALDATLFTADGQAGIVVKLRESSPDKLPAIRDGLLALNLDSVPFTRSQAAIPAPKPYTAASLIREHRHEHPEVVMRALQEGYLHGRISYPRTDSSTLYSGNKITVAGVADGLHMGMLLRDNWQDGDAVPGVEKFAQGGHPGLHPTLGILGAVPGGYSALAQRLEKMIAARAIASLMGDATVLRDVATVSIDGVPVRLERIVIDEAGWLRAYSRMGIRNPIEPDAAQATGRKALISEQVPTASDFVSWCSQAGIGRPSTLAFLPKKMQENGLLTPYFTLTQAGRALLGALTTAAPALVDPGFTRDTEAAFEKLAGDSRHYIDTVSDLLAKMGCGVETLGALDQGASSMGAAA